MHHIYEWTDAAHVAAGSDPAAEAAVPEHPVLHRALRRSTSSSGPGSPTRCPAGRAARTRTTSPARSASSGCSAAPASCSTRSPRPSPSVDWMMSLDPHWFSTIFGLLFLIQQALAAIGFVLLLMASMSKTLPMSRIVRASDIHDYGKFLLAFVMVWAYFSFSQFLIIWSANLPEEIPWYLERDAQRLGVVQHPAARRPVLPAVLPAAVARPEAHRRPRRHRRRPGAGDALRRLLLERDAGAEPRDADAALDQPGDASSASAASGSRSSLRSTRPRRCCRSAIRIFRRRSRAMAHTNQPDRSGFVRQPAETHVHPGGEVHGHGVRATSAAVHHEVTDIPLGGLTRAAVIAVVFVGLVMAADVGRVGLLPVAGEAGRSRQAGDGRGGLRAAPARDAAPAERA